MAAAVKRDARKQAPSALLALVGWLATIAAAAWGLYYVHGYVRAHRPEVSCQLELEDLPLWLALPENQWVLKGPGGLEDAAGLRPDDDLYDPNLCARVGEGLAASPWVAEVERVVKDPNGVIRVRAKYREPVAYVERRGRAYLIDAERALLPVECAAEKVSRDEWFVITGVAKPPPPAPPQRWDGNDLAAGLKLAAFLREAKNEGKLPFRSSLRAIDVGTSAGKDTLLRIHTIYPGCYIDWGLPPGEENEVDTSTARRKLEMLNTLYAGQGRLPEQILVVRWKEEIRPLPPRKQ